MKLANTLMINETLLPSNKKAFTLAEVLITLSILGVVAALTIPSLINRQSDLAAQVKIKKAIANFENFAEVYMVENETTDLTDLKCSDLANYFKIVNGSGCNFVTADGVAWSFENSSNALTGKVTVNDSFAGPRYAVSMWALNGQANGLKASDGQPTAPSSLYTTLNADSGVSLINSRTVTTPEFFLKGQYYCKTSNASISVDSTTKDATVTCADPNS